MGRTERDREQIGERIVLFLFFFYSFLSQIYGNLIVGIRRAKNEKCSMRRGLRVGTKNTGFHLEFR